MLIVLKTCGIETPSIRSEVSLIRISNVIVTETKKKHSQWQK